MNKQEIMNKLMDLDRRYTVEFKKLLDDVQRLTDKGEIHEPLKAITGHLYEGEYGDIYLCCPTYSSVPILLLLGSGCVYDDAGDCPFGHNSDEFTHIGSFDEWLEKRLTVTDEDLLIAGEGYLNNHHLAQTAENLTRMLQEREQ